MAMDITITIDELHAIYNQIAERTAALLRPSLDGIRKDIQTMSGTLESQLQAAMTATAAAQAATSAALGAIAADLTALAGRLVPGATVTQADVDAATAIATVAGDAQTAAVAAQAQADALVTPPAP
jgi:chromosome segregation ATPase